MDPPLVLSLNSPWYEMVKEGKKVYEGRRMTDKIRSIAEGQVLVFNHHTNKLLDPIHVIVEDILSFPTFEEALRSLPIERVLPIPGITIEQGVEIYKRYVSLETQAKDGVAMIKVGLVRTGPQLHAFDEVHPICL